MELLAFFRRVIAWRWTPCVAPVIGSLLIALLTFLVVPDEIGAGAGSGPLALRGKSGATSNSAADDASAEDPSTAAARAPRHALPGNARHRAPAEAAQGFFQDAQEPPHEPLAPTPQPAPAELAPQPPAGTVFTPPEPVGTLPPPLPAAALPPEEPGTLPPPNVPLTPLGPP